MAVEWLATAIRHNAESSVGHVVKQRTVRLGKMDDGCGVSRSINSFYQLVSCRFQRSQRAIANAVQRPLHVARGERSPVVKMNPLAQMENVSFGIRNFPLFRHPRRHVEVLVA